MKKLSVLLAVLLALSLVFVGCGGGEGSDGEDKVSVGMVTDTGGVNDQSFNQSAWEGLQEARDDLGIRVAYKESNQDADYVPNMESLYDADFDLIWGIGFKMADAILQSSRQNPEQKYAIIDNSYGEDTPENVLGVVFKAEQASFLCGYIAGKMTETGKVGFVGGMDFPVIWGFHYGFMAGVKYANQDVEVLEQYAESFTDAAKGKSIANSMFQQDADIVFHAAGGVGDGVIEAAKEQDQWAIGVDRDQNYLAPDNVLTSAMKRVGTAMYVVAEDLVNGKFQGGRTVSYGLAEGAVGLAPSSSKHVPADLLNEADKLKKSIIDGEIVVPVDEAGYETFVSNL